MAAHGKLYKSFQFTSEQKSWTTGGQSALDFEGFVELHHDGGKRVVIDGFELHAQASLTVATATTFGEDLYKIFRALTVEQKDKVKRADNLSGQGLRIYDYGVMDPAHVNEAQDFAVGGPTTVYVSAYFPLRKEWTENPEAFSMPADLFKLVRIYMAQNGDMSIGTSAVTINSITYWVVADCHAEDTVIGHSVDTVYERDFDSQLETQLVVGGRTHDLYLFAPGAHGGQLLTGLNEVNVLEEFQQSQLVWPDLTRRYARERDEATNLGSTTGQRARTNPFVPAIADNNAPRAVAAILSTGNRPNEGQVRDHLRCKTVQSGFTAGTIRCVVRDVIERTAKADQIVAKKYGSANKVPIAPQIKGVGSSPVNAKDINYLPVLHRK